MPLQPNEHMVAFSAPTEKELMSRVRESNKLSPERKITLAQAKAVYRRASRSFSAQDRYRSRHEFAMTRVNAFMDLVATGRPHRKSYTQDFDLLPAQHPLSTQTTIASGSRNVDSELTVRLLDASEVVSPEHAILNLTEFAGLGYEAMPAFRAAWKRGVDASEDPFGRARELATKLYDSRDADLLPVEGKA